MIFFFANNIFPLSHRRDHVRANSSPPEPDLKTENCRFWGSRHIETTDNYKVSFIPAVSTAFYRQMCKISNFLIILQKICKSRKTPLWTGRPTAKKHAQIRELKSQLWDKKSDMKFISRSRYYFILRGSKVKSAGIRLHTEQREGKFGHHGTLFTKITLTL